MFLVGTLGASVRMVGLIEGGAEAIASILKLASGWWSDHSRRRKPLIVAGYTVASLARPLVGLAQSSAQVMLIRFTDRVGKGVRGAPRDALLAASTPEQYRGSAFGFHRAADHAGAVVGPLIAAACLVWLSMPLRHVFLVAAIPGALAVLVAIFAVREETPGMSTPPALTLETESSAGHPHDAQPATGPMPASFTRVMVPITLFTLGNSTDAFLILRANQLGVPLTMIPVLWVLLHLVKSLSSVPGGALSDRVGRAPVIIGGWIVYAAVYAGLAMANESWHAWALFAIYGVVFGLSEGTEKALIADLVPPARRGRAFGWYHAMIGFAALPASAGFGVVWAAYGASAAFLMGAALALAASVLMLLLPDLRSLRADRPLE